MIVKLKEKKIVWLLKKNQPKKTSWNLEKLVQPLESKINPYNLWKDLQIIINEKSQKKRKTIQTLKKFFLKKKKQ